jgi:hypothetical protein
VSFDPALVRFEQTGDPTTGTGQAIALHYGGVAHWPHGAIPGLRYKYPFRSDGFIIKTEVFHDRLCRPEGGALPVGFGQSGSEWEVWEATPAELRTYMAPLLCHAYQRVEQALVIWTAQAWVESVRTVGRKEANVVYETFRRHGYKTNDTGPHQFRRPPDSGPVLIDWGHWVAPRHP